jgi:hypothetical protein
MLCIRELIKKWSHHLVIPSNTFLSWAHLRMRQMSTEGGMSFLFYAYNLGLIYCPSQIENAPKKLKLLRHPAAKCLAISKSSNGHTSSNDNELPKVWIFFRF